MEQVTNTNKIMKTNALITNDIMIDGVIVLALGQNLTMKYESGRAPETKMLPCATKSQKWHLITQPWEIFELPSELGISSTT